MFEFLHRHELACVFLLVALTIAVVMHYERWQDRKAVRETTHHVWQCVQFNGGGSVYTPVFMDKAQACEWASKLGQIAYVDAEHYKIFYRARSSG